MFEKDTTKNLVLTILDMFEYTSIWIYPQLKLNTMELTAASNHQPQLRKQGICELPKPIGEPIG